MSWLWGGKSSKTDPTASLPPDLKDFLNEQQPRPYVPSGVPTAKSEEGPKRAQAIPPDTNKTHDERPLPRESLFQDGRYKDIWNTYTPQNEITAATTTPVDRIIAARKDRRQLVHRAAMENCAFEQELHLTCMYAGNLANRTRARITMCRQETKAFNRCFQLQAKFLQALGYMTSTNTSNEDEERIQMHADRLYHKMMDYEAAVEQATRDNVPIPPLSSVFNPAQPAPTIEQLNLPPNMERRLKTPLHELPPHERELAVRAALQEAKMANFYADDFQVYAVEMNQGRKNRQGWLVKAFGEPIGKFIVPDPPQEPEAKAYPLEDLERKIWHDRDPKLETTIHPKPREQRDTKHG